MQHRLHTACLRPLRRRRRSPHRDEIPFSLALALELTWLSAEQRSELETLGSPNPTRLPDNVIPFARYHPERILRSVESPPAPRQPRWHWATAFIVATVFLSISPLVLYWLGPTSGEYLTGMGEHRTIPLADGSTVTMNTHSRLKVRLSAHERNIELLEGEALFSVAHDAARPFKVQARQTIIEVIGTQFSVYLSNSGTQIAVSQGRVRVFDLHEPQAGLTVSAGEQARVSRDDALQTNFEVQLRRMTPGELERRLAWVDGEIAFDGETLQEAAEQFNRYNWRQLKVSDPAIANVHIGGWFKSTNVDGFIGALHRLFGLRAVPTTDPFSQSQVIELERRPTGPPPP